MFHHISIPVDNPLHVAKVLAEIWHGRSLPFAICPDSYIVLAGDKYGTAIELIPSGTEMKPGKKQVEYEHNAKHSRFSGVRAAISVPTNQHEVEQIGVREDWRVILSTRGQFKVIEFWVENKFLLELLTPTITRQYIESMNLKKLRSKFDWRYSWSDSGATKS